VIQCYAELSLFFDKIPEHIAGFTPSWHKFLNSAMAAVSLLTGDETECKTNKTPGVAAGYVAD